DSHRLRTWPRRYAEACTLMLLSPELLVHHYGSREALIAELLRRLRVSDAHGRAAHQTFLQLGELQSEGRPIAIVPTTRVKGGLSAAVGHLWVFLPASQCALDRGTDPATLIGKTLTCTILKLRERGSSVVVSHKAWLESTSPCPPAVLPAVETPQTTTRLGLGAGVLRTLTCWEPAESTILHDNLQDIHLPRLRDRIWRSWMEHSPHRASRWATEVPWPQLPRSAKRRVLKGTIPVDAAAWCGVAGWMVEHTSRPQTLANIWMHLNTQPERCLALEKELRNAENTVGPRGESLLIGMPMSQAERARRVRCSSDPGVRAQALYSLVGAQEHLGLFLDMLVEDDMQVSTAARNVLMSIRPCVLRGHPALVDTMVRLGTELHREPPMSLVRRVFSPSVAWEPAGHVPQSC
ncbi:MAG: hypothetical protein AAFX99_15485, partial [Myxococcota bacterium]